MIGLRANTLAAGIAIIVTALAAWPPVRAQVRASGPDVQPASQGTLSGVVEADRNGIAPQPVNRAYVTMAADSFRRFTLTDGEGRFSFVGVEPGKYLLTASKAGYVDSAYGASRPLGAGTPIVVETGQSVADVRVTLVRGVAITGTIVGVDGEPAANLLVTARPVGADAGHPQRSTQGMTDDRGTYRLFGLAPGGYRVMVMPDRAPYRAMRVSSTAEIDRELAELKRRYRASAGSPPGAPGRGALRTDDAGAAYSYAPVYYPSTTDALEAQVIELAAGEERVGVDFSLVLTGTVSISGAVTEADGRPAADIRIMTFRAGSESASLALRPSAAVTQRDGTFRVANLAPGRYIVQARRFVGRPPASTVRLSEWASETIEIVAGTPTHLALRLRPALTLVGRVDFDGSALQAPADLSAVSVNLGLSATDPQGPGALTVPAATVGADGTFELRGLVPGTYDVNVSTPAPGWRARSAVLEGRDLLDQPLEIDGTSRGGPLLVTFTDRRTSLEGTLENLAGRAAPQYTVIAFPADRALWSSPRRVVKARPDTAGRFHLTDLPAGDYVLAVLTDATPAVEGRAALLDAVAPAAVPVAIREGTPVMQNLRVQRD